MNDVETAIRDYVLELLGAEAPEHLDAATPLLADDLLDSVGIYEVVVFVEERFGIEILDEEVVPENFGSIQLLARLVESKR